MTNSENPNPSNKEQEILNQKIEEQKRKIQKEKLKGLISQLNEQEQKVLKLRFAQVYPYQFLTHEQIGDKLNLSRQRISQIEKKFVEKLRTVNKMTTVLDTKRLED